MTHSNPDVDFYFNKSNKWQEETKHLRKIVLACGLAEELKWGVPCYNFKDAKIVLIHEFKNYCALLFFKGALLNDGNKILIQQTKNVQAARQIRFTNLAQILELETVLKVYIYEAIEVEKAGLKVVLKDTAAFEMVDEFRQALEKKPALKKAFSALTPGRQRGYMLYFAAPKQAKTRQMRVEKFTPNIMNGKGLNDV